MAAEKVEAAVAASVPVLCFVKVPVFISIIKVYLLTQVPSILNTVVTKIHHLKTQLLEQHFFREWSELFHLALLSTT